MIEFYMLLKSNDYEVSIKSFRIEFYTKPLIFKTIGIKNYVEILSKNDFNQNTYKKMRTHTLLKFDVGLILHENS